MRAACSRFGAFPRNSRAVARGLLRAEAHPSKAEIKALEVADLMAAEPLPRFGLTKFWGVSASTNVNRVGKQSRD